MVAYLDLILLENFSMNYIILYTTGKLLNRKIKARRMIIASIIGVVYVFSLWVNVPKLILNTTKVLMCILLVKISFGSKKFKNIIKESAVCILVACIYAGCALGFIHICKPRVLYMVNGIIIGGEYIFELVLISSVLSFFLIKIVMNFIKLKNRLKKEDMICKIEIVLNNKTSTLKALLDTGNLLVDPISKYPVVVVNIRDVEELFSEDTLVKINSMIGGDASKCDNSFDTKIRIVPYTSVGNKDGIMVAYKVDKIKVEYHDEINELDEVLIGFYNDALSKNNKYSALIGLQILERSKVKVEYTSCFKSKGKYSVC